MATRRTFDIIYRFDPERSARRPKPKTPAEARARLVHGNRAFAEVLDARNDRDSSVIPIDAQDLGHGAERGLVPEQAPFAAVLGCSDARAPVEMVFQQRSNDLFVVRVAGNGLASACVGSLDYAVAHFAKSLRLVVVLGHSHCGAVTAAVDAFLAPRSYLAMAANHPLRAIVDGVLVAVRTAHLALESAHGARVRQRPGYRAALVEASVALNAALAAYALKQETASRRCAVLYGSYDLASRFVRLPLAPPGAPVSREIGLFPPPEGVASFRRLAGTVAGSASVARLLAGSGPASRGGGH